MNEHKRCLADYCNVYYDTVEAQLVEKSLVFCKLLVATPTANYGTCNVMVFMNGEDLGRKLFYIKIGATNVVEGLLNMDGSSCNAQQ